MRGAACRRAQLLREGQVLFTYLHLAPDAEQTRDLVASGAICIAYETVTSAAGGPPLLAPMSEVAGRLSIQAGALPGEVGRRHGRAAGGRAGRGADALRRIDATFNGRVMTVFSNRDNVEREVLRADLVVSGVLTPGAAAPKLITRAMLPRMKPGSVIVDVAIDQGGSVDTSRPTTHAEPTCVVDGVVRYMVANMPGAVPRASTHALNSATLPFTLALAEKGWRLALHDDPHLKAGLNVAKRHVTYKAVARALSMSCTPADALVM